MTVRLNLLLILFGWVQFANGYYWGRRLEREREEHRRWMAIYPDDCAGR